MIDPTSFSMSVILTLQENWCMVARKVLFRLLVRNVWTQISFCRVRKKRISSNPGTSIPVFSVISCFLQSIFVSVQQTFEIQVITNLVPSKTVKSMPFYIFYVINFKCAFLGLFPTFGCWRGCTEQCIALCQLFSIILVTILSL